MNQYILYLNGNQYGTGNLLYMKELIRDYLNRMESFGVEEAAFKIEKRK